MGFSSSLALDGRLVEHRKKLFPCPCVDSLILQKFVSSRGYTSALQVRISLASPLKLSILILILMKYVAGPFNIDATGRELGKNLVPMMNSFLEAVDCLSAH